MKKPSVSTVQKYLSILRTTKAKYVTSERLSDLMGLYPEKINDDLSYFDSMVNMDYSYDLKTLIPLLEEYVKGKGGKKDSQKQKEVKMKQVSSKYASINDFVYQKMSFAGLVDKNAYLSDEDLKDLKQLIALEQAKRKKSKK